MAGKLRRGIVGLILGVCSLLGQQQNTVYQTLFANQSTIPLVSQRINNIGQGQHILTVQMNSAAGHTCPNVTYLDAEIDGSFDDVNYHQITPSLITIYYNNLQNDWINTTQGLGAYPYLRAVVLNFDTTNCVLSANYTGLLYPNAQFSTTPNANVSTAGIGAQLFSIPIVLTTSGTTVLFNAPTPNRNVIVYGLYIWSTVAQTITFTQTQGGVFQNNLFSVPLAANAMVYLPQSTYQLFAANNGGVVGQTTQISINASAVGNVFGLMYYIVE